MLVPLLAILILAAAPRLAAAESTVSAKTEPAEPAIELTTPAQVKALCAALESSDLLRFDGDPAEAAFARRAHDQARDQAVARAYRVEVPAKGFAFGHYRTGQDEVELDGDRPLRAVEDALALDLAGIDEVAFHASPDALSKWSKQKKAGALKLIVTFRPSGERCPGSNAARAWRLGGIPISWQLAAEGGAVLASADENGQPLEGRAAAPGADAAEPPPRTAQVQKISLDVDSGEEEKIRLVGVQGALDRCAASAHRRGSMVVAFTVQSGHVRDPQVIMDASRDEETSSCVAHALSGAALAGASSSASGRGTATVGLQ